MDWSLPIPLTLALSLAGLVYALGWLSLRALQPGLISAGQAVIYASGLTAVWVAVGSPLAHLDHKVLLVHMLNHMLLMGVASPLILLGAPVLAFSHGLPKPVAASVSRFFHFVPTRSTRRIISNRVFCWFAGTVTVLVWHVPAIFQLAHDFHLWHATQQASFLAAGLLFWSPVIRPSSQVRTWSVPVYLFLATLPCDALSAFLTFCDRVVYGPYLVTGHQTRLSPIQDQEWAGVLMWVCVTIIYLVPAMVVTVHLLSPRNIGEVESRLLSGADRTLEVMAP